MTSLKDAHAQKNVREDERAYVDTNRCVSTKETHVNGTKGAPKHQKTKSQRAKREVIERKEKYRLADHEKAEKARKRLQRNDSEAVREARSKLLNKVCKL